MYVWRSEDDGGEHSDLDVDLSRTISLYFTHHEQLTDRDLVNNFSEENVSVPVITTPINV